MNKPLKEESAMKCREMNNMLSLYIDRMLEDSQVKEIEEHLAACETCRNEYHGMKEIADLLGQTEVLPVPDGFNFRLKKALQEEKQNMIHEGILSKPASRKNKWRVITSVAAVFAVGVISFSMYQDILGSLPDRISGQDQAPAASEEKIYTASEENEGALEQLKQDSNSSSDGSVMMKNTDNNAPATGLKEPDAGGETDVDDVRINTIESGGLPEKEGFTYGQANESESGFAEDSAAMADSGETLGIARNFESGTMNKLKAPAADCSRSLASTGIERNSAAVQYYNKLIEERLSNFEFQILESSYTNTGEWHFRVFIFRGKDGNTYNEEITICGREGKIVVISPNSHTE